MTEGLTLNYDAENRLVSVSGAATASFLYDADGKQVKAVVDSTTTYYVGMHYQVDNGVVTKYYLAGASRIAMRKNGTLYYMLTDHLGSTSITLNSSGSKIAELRYKAWGETRYSSGTTYTSYQFTSQRNETALGLYFYNARWYDPYLNRFTQPDSIVPLASQGTQAWDRYAYANNDPVRYNDPTGHKACDEINANGTCYTEDDITKGKKEAASNQGCSNPTYCENGKPKSPGGLNEITQRDHDTTQTPPPPELSFAQKTGMIVAAILFDVVITIIELQIAALMIEAAAAGPLGIALDVAVLGPAELFLIDLEIGVSTYVYDVITSGTKEGNDMEFHIIIPLLKDLVNSN